MSPRSTACNPKLISFSNGGADYVRVQLWLVLRLPRRGGAIVARPRLRDHGATRRAPLLSEKGIDPLHSGLADGAIGLMVG